MIVMAIDPGSEQSAWLIYDTALDRVETFAIAPNDDLLTILRNANASPEGWDVKVVVIEKIEGYGMAVGAEVFATVHWSGRFTEAAHPTRVEQMPRRTVKLNLCGSPKAKDPNIRQALLDRFGGASAVGVKRSPGPLYGISKDVWSALAVAVTWADQEARR